MIRLLLIISFFLLSGCEEHCIRPQDIGVREKFNIVSTQQKWVSSEVEVSEGMKVVGIDIVANELDFCTKQGEMSKDVLVYPNPNQLSVNILYLPVELPFELKAGDTISFSIIENKICKNNGNGDKRPVNIDETCSEEETAYFAKILNQQDCDSQKCPNKYILTGGSWLNGKEYWPDNMKEDEIRATKEEIEKALRQNGVIDCSSLLNMVGKIDTYLLNLMNKKCNSQNFAQFESLINSQRLISDLEDALSNTSDGYAKVAEAIRKFTEVKEVETYIPSLMIYMNDENFNHIPGVILTNYGYEIKKDHSKGEKLFFNLGYGNSGKGGYNIRVKRNINLNNKSINTNHVLYMHVADSIPKHNPGENTTDDIPVDISKVYDYDHIEDIMKKLNRKTGKIYFGIKDYGCDYKNNKGNFNINITAKEPPVRTFSAIYNFFDTGVKKAFFGFNNDTKKPNSFSGSGDSPTKSLYESFVTSNKSATATIRSTIIALLVLYIVLYTLYYFFGLTHASIHEFLIVCVKIAIITQLLRDDSWNFFYNNAFSIFVNSPIELIKIANLRGTDPNVNVFEFLDLPLNRFLSWQSILLIVSLLFSGPLGIIAFCLVIWGFIVVSLAIFNILFSFITSIAVIALLLSLAPIFIICALFQYTRQMFFRWVGYLARFAIYPVILLICVSLISQVMDYIVYSVFNFEVCSKCILSINLKLFEPCLFYYYAAKHTPNITAIMAFIILGHAMKALLEAASEISDTLFSSYVSGEPGKQYKQSLLGIGGIDEHSRQERQGHAPAQALSKRPQIPQQRSQGSQKPQIPNEK